MAQKPAQNTKTDAAPAPVADPEIPVEVVEPEEGEDEELVQLVRTGWVRLHFGGRTVRLRRPFFGELKKLRLALEEAADTISEAADEAQLTAQRLMEDQAQANADESLTAEERVTRTRALQRENRVVGRKLTALGEQERLAWWALVVATIGVGDEFPEDENLPAWIIDPALPNLVIQHWRSVPLGRG